MVALEARFDRTPDGRVWSDGSFDYSFWRRYLDVFAGVRVVARIRDVPRVPPHAGRADGPQVTFAAIPYFIGPWQFARRQGEFRRAIHAAYTPGDAMILRVPGTIGTYLARPAQATGQPYGVEVIGDPYDVFAPGGVRSVLRPLMRWWYPRHLRRQCAAACAAAYVTAGYLQRRYPAAVGAFVTSYSSIELPDEAFVERPRPPPPTGGLFRLLLIGSLDQLYKGPDVLIEALAANVARGLDLRLTIVGDGQYRPELEALVRRRGVAERVEFTGRLPAGPAVRDQLDRADLFVLPSRTEGLPKVLIEAMARGLPCLGSHIGGFPELLPADDLVPPGDSAALAERIRIVLGDAERRAKMAAQNIAKAREYRSETLQARRHAFYDAVYNATTAWLRRNKDGP